MQYAELIESYRPSPQTIALLRQTPLVLLAGITGGGRDTIIDKLEGRGGYFSFVTTTTREPRVNNGILEREGVEYYFIDTERALGMLERHEYVEVSVVHERINGLSTAELERVHSSGKIGISDIDPMGVAKYKQLSPDIIAIFVVPPSYEEWRRRVRARYETDEAFEAGWPPRRESAIRELKNALEAPYYHFVINDDLAEAVDACDKITHSGNSERAENEEARTLVRRLLDRFVAEAAGAI